MTKFLNISTDNTLGGSSPSEETVSSQKAIKEYVDNNTAPAGNYVTTDTAQTITAAKTFTKAVHFTGTGDNNAVFLTENTRFDIEGTTRTILGMGNAQFYINHSAYALLLRGKNARPSYNSATSYLALLSDLDGYVPTTRTVNGKALSSDISLTASDVGALPDSTIIPTVNNPTITFTQGGTTKGTITLNQSGDQTIEFDAGGSGGSAVDSVNGQTGTVVLDAEDVGALPDTTVIPTDTADLTNGAGFITSSALSGYQTTITGGATTITSSNLTASRALISNSSGKVAVSDVTSTELGYLDGVTSAIQTQLNNKQAKIGAGTANNIVAYSGTAGTLNTLTRTTSVRAKASASDTYIPTEKAVATSLDDKYDASNPAGYTTNVGTVTSVNNVQPVNGNVSLSIPTVNNATLTIQKNGTTVKTFTANASSDVTCNITVPTQASDIGAQETLVSGTNIKTINNTTILGSGNISIESLPSQSGQSGKYLTTNGTTASWGIPKTFDLLDWKWADHELNDQSWLNADTFSWQNGTTYSDVYSHLVADINGKTATSETVGSYTISYYLADDGHKITTDESTVANIYNETGEAWYYVLDTTNQRFKLPRSSHGGVVEKYASGTDWYRVYADGWCEQGGTVSNSASSLTVSLLKTFVSTNYSLNVYKRANDNDTGGYADSHCEVNGGSPYDYGQSTTGFRCSTASSAAEFTWEASGYVSSYPSNGQYKYLYFYVGEYSQTATEQTAGLNSSLFNGKMDLDMGNMNPTSTVKSTITGWGVPDYNSGVSITSPYTPTKDGIIIAQRSAKYSTAQIRITDGIIIARHQSSDSSSSDNIIWANVKAGVSYTITAGTITFYPFIGA